MQNVGKLNEDWLYGMRQNADSEQQVRDAIAAVGNWSRAEIDADRNVWVEGAGGGTWLSQDDVDHVCRTIDAGA